MESIPKPEVLDPDRVLRDDREDMSAADHRSQAQLLDGALHQSCDYAGQLWETLDAVREYLHSSLPPEPNNTDRPDPGRPDTGQVRLSPDDDQAWQEWIDVSAAVTSVLCGPHGDSGFGREQAVHEAQIRRSPEPTLSDVIAPPPVSLAAEAPRGADRPDLRPAPAQAMPSRSRGRWCWSRWRFGDFYRADRAAME